MNEILTGPWILVIIIVLLLFGGRLLGNGNGNGGVTEAVNAAINNQTTQSGIRDILLASAGNNYETLKAITDQNMVMMNQNNSNTIAAIQGFNEVQRAIQTQGSGIMEAISGLGYQLSSCCSELKTMFLQGRYEDLQEKYRSVQTDASNAAQSQYLLGVMGKWIANPAAVAV